MPSESTRSSIYQLPGPEGLPVLGNLLQIDLQKLHSILEAWAERYGSVYRFRLAHKTVVAVSDPGLIQTVLRERTHAFRSAGSMEQIARRLGSHGVFSAEGE